jgi:hypothetical protein
VDIQEYARFILDNQDLVYRYVNLDKIPAEPGRYATPEEGEESARVSYENLQALKSHGLKPIPVFHQGERFYWLERMLNDGDDYIGLSYKKVSIHGARAWLADCYDFLMKIGFDGTNIRLHGFGNTSFSLTPVYPFFSIDSTSWVRYAAMGRMLVPVNVERENSGKIGMRPVLVSNRPNRKGAVILSRTFLTLPPAEREKVEDWCRKSGLSVDDCSFHYSDLTVLNTRAMKEFFRAVPKPLVLSSRTSLLASKDPIKSKETFQQSLQEVYYATTFGHFDLCYALSRNDIKFILLSYWDIAREIKKGRKGRSAAESVKILRTALHGGPCSVGVSDRIKTLGPQWGSPLHEKVRATNLQNRKTWLKTLAGDENPADYESA